MSFLANLRDKSTPQTTQALCYFLVDGRGGAWQLALKLCELEEGVIKAMTGPYIMQRAHLHAPPAFLSQQDIAILQALLAAHSIWLEQSHSKALPNNTQDFIRLLADTHKLFLLEEGGPNRVVTLGEAVLLPSEWILDRAGNQTLSLVVGAREEIVEIGDQFFAFNKHNRELRPVLNHDCPMFKTFFKTRLMFDEVTAFLEAYRSDFEAKNLPLPRLFSAVAQQGQVEPVLIARTVKEKGQSAVNELVLVFRYTLNEVCFALSFGENAKNLAVFVAEKIIYVQPDYSMQDKTLVNIIKILNPIGPASDAGVWRFTQKSQWQALFYENQKVLKSMGVMLSIQAGFEYPYILGEAFEIKAKQTDEALTLDVCSTVNGEVLSLRNALKNLERGQAGEKYLELVLDNEQIMLLPLHAAESLMSELGDWIQSGCRPLSGNQEYRLHKLQDSLSEMHVNIDGGNPAANEIWHSPVEMSIRKDTVNAELRPYQWLGVYWLLHIHNCGFNGLLADDMGLGKTLQTITFLSVLKQEKRLQGLAVVVAPTSLLHNWRNEIEKFCPELSTCILHGSMRHQKWQALEATDVAITSYQSLVNDVENWQAQDITWLILDEAQTIKNPKTKARQALVQLKCANRLCLSGTPVENHLGEMWSLLDFLMPGILGADRHFKSYYQSAIEKKGDEERFKHLLARIAPFVLRRTKTEVALDLPEKTEITQKIELPEKQYQFYEELKNAHWLALQEEMNAKENQGQQHIMMLTALLKLRQACCDPLLLGEPNIPSGKTDYCVDMLQELVEEGGSVLVFSQFTSVLEILAKRLQAIDIEYLCLTGKSKNRDRLVSDFQSAKAPVFLISLKAGGTGLNLTQADTVIHFDPWWNQAAQAQASDRAHRIGQNKPVFVYKLIAQNTIEEKIALLQASKAALSNAVNQTAQSSAKKFAMSLEELTQLWQD